MCYSKYEEIVLDEANNGRVDDLEVKEIEVESSIKREEGSEDMKEESEGLQTERICGKESEIKIVELIKKENELNNEDLKRKVPVNEVNNGVKTVPEVLKIIKENSLNESTVSDETREMNDSIVPNELPVNNKVEVIKEVAEINENKVEHLSKSEELVKEIVSEMSETINEKGLNESAVPEETGEMNENILDQSIVPNELSVDSEVEVIRKVEEINENKMAQEEEHLSKSE